MQQQTGTQKPGTGNGYPVVVPPSPRWGEGSGVRGEGARELGPSPASPLAHKRPALGRQVLLPLLQVAQHLAQQLRVLPRPLVIRPPGLGPPDGLLEALVLPFEPV